jgi:alpha-galactosidase
MKIAISFLLAILLSHVASDVIAQTNASGSCKAELKNDTLVIENNLFAYKYIWNKGHIALVSLMAKSGGKCRLSATSVPSPDIQIPGISSEPSDATFTSTVVKRNKQEYLRGEVFVKFGELAIKRVFRIYPDSPALACDLFIKGTCQEWHTQKDKIENELIEKPDTPEGKGNFPLFGFLPLLGKHWKIQTVNFTEATDHNNTLVEEASYLLYRKPLMLQGNLIFSKDLISGCSAFILKESPLPESQHAYPGFDFMVSEKGLAVAGLGTTWADIKKDTWTQAYSFAFGLTDPGEYARLAALRQYQKCVRPLLPDRDELITSNTWGDRSKDGRVNEKFILAEMEAGKKMGITCVQLDDGWQKGLSKNSASATGKLWDKWDATNWEPHLERFPNGLNPVVRHANKLGLELGLWFNPSKHNSYENWEQDANVLIAIFKKYGIRVFKIDGINLSDKKSETNLRSFFNKVNETTEGRAVFNMDVTAGNRPAFFFLNEYGSVFLENRYTDWGNYYPHWTLRNLWMLSKYYPPEMLQIEFLNKWRNKNKYPSNDMFAPSNLSFEYQFAIAMMAQPLAWLELSNLPDEAFALVPVLEKYRTVMHDMHKGVILPIGEEPSGRSWTGFQSVVNDKEGYVLVFRENNEQARKELKLFLSSGKKISLTNVLGEGNDFNAIAENDGAVVFQLEKVSSYALYKYTIE